jgi:hypothetical protein
MKTKAEIEESIQLHSYLRREQQNPFHYSEAQQARLESWIQALEWVIDESFDFPSTYPLFIDEVTDAPEETFSIEEEFPHLTGRVLEEIPKQDQS